MAALRFHGIDARFDPTRDDVPVDTEGFCDTLLRLAGAVSLDKVVDIKQDVLSAQVYNLESRHGWYIANGIITHNCRCVPAPAGVDALPPKMVKGESWQEDPSTAAFLMLRAPHPDTGKTHYLLHQRNDGAWGMPGGTSHVGEHPLVTAVREATEEIGDLPSIRPSAYLAHQDEDRTAHIFVCDVPWFTPKLNGGTPEETQGTGWFRKKDIKNLKLHPKFKNQWDRIDWDNINKHQIVTENGEQLTVSDPGEPLFPAGARWPYPHRSDGAGRSSLWH